ncbi:metallophosphoesterase [Carboxylicivirga linearis]|nr:metallophosphoesterase [Carboxylicivirga linearis]
MNFRDNIEVKDINDNNNYSQKGGYDIIGDVHGHYSELKMLLKRMGYSRDNGFWEHPERKAVFVGDFINRGPNSLKVIQAIRAMVSNGSGYAILGNHEINAITYFTKRSDGRPIKTPRNNNRKLLDSFFAEYKNNYEELQADIKWMRTLPLFLNLGKIRVVHAYWNDNHIKKVSRMYENGRLRKKFLRDATRKESSLYTPFLQTIKGVEINLPKDLVIKDSNNIARTNFRVKWWVEPHGHTFDSLSYGNKFSLPKYTIPNELITQYDIYPEEDPLVFIGHYCAGNGGMIPQKNICCVDACVANGGKLAAYRYSGEKSMDPNRLVFVDKKVKISN